MKKMLSQLFLMGSIIVSISSFATEFTDESLFQVAATNYVLEDFDSYSEGTAFGDLTSLGITFSDQGGGLPEVWSYASSIGASPKSQPNNLGNRPIGEFSTQPYVFSATSDKLIIAVGLWNIGTDDNIILEFFDDQNALIEDHIINSGPATFGGIVNLSGATTVVVRHGSEGNGFMGFDDLQVELASPNPKKPEISVENGFIKMDTTEGYSPNAIDCSLPDHYGRTVIDEVADILYICIQTGWSAH